MVEKRGILGALMVKWPLFQLLAMVTGTFNIICSGMHYGWPSPSLPRLLTNESHIPVTNEEGSWIAVTLMLGAVCGSFLGGAIVDVLGRKNVVLISSIPFFAAWIMVIFAKSVIVLLVARFIAGISDGLAFCSVTIYLGEVADPKFRGFLGSWLSISLIFGVLLINVLGSHLSVPITAMVSSTIPLLTLLTFVWMPESPYYFIMKGKLEEAKQSLQIYRGGKDIDEEFNTICKAVEEQTAKASGKFLDLFTVKSNRKALYIMLGTRAAQQLSGVTALMFYLQIILKETESVISANTASTIYFGIELILNCFSSALVDKAGRRPLMVFSIIGSGLMLFVEAFYFYYQKSSPYDLNIVPVVALLIFVVVFSLGMQTVPIILLSEIFPTNVKAFAVGLADVYFAVLTTVISKFFQITKDSFGLHVPFFFFGVCCFLGLFFIVFYVPETKGKTLEEIQEELKSESSSSMSLWGGCKKKAEANVC